MQALRSMLAIILGFAVFSLSSRLFLLLTGIDLHNPPNFFLMIIGVLYSAAVAFGAGYLAGRIAGQKAIVHAFSISVLLLFGVGMSMILSSGAKWTIFTTLIISIPMTFAGAMAYSTTHPDPDAPQPQPAKSAEVDLDELLKDEEPGPHS